mgnify:CR=1 FL=1
MTHEEIRQYFETGDPDADDTISILSVRRILYDYAQTFDIELSIEEHLPGNKRIHFDTFTEYFLRNTTDAALMAYHPTGQLRWRSNLPETAIEGSEIIEKPTEMLPPSAEENAVSMDMAIDILDALQSEGSQITFADFLRFHDAEGLRTLNLKI